MRKMLAKIIAVVVFVSCLTGCEKQTVETRMTPKIEVSEHTLTLRVGESSEFEIVDYDDLTGVEIAVEGAEIVDVEMEHGVVTVEGLREGQTDIVISAKEYISDTVTVLVKDDADSYEKVDDGKKDDLDDRTSKKDTGKNDLDVRDHEDRAELPVNEVTVNINDALATKYICDVPASECDKLLTDGNYDYDVDTMVDYFHRCGVVFHLVYDLEAIDSDYGKGVMTVRLVDAMTQLVDAIREDDALYLEMLELGNGGQSFDADTRQEALELKDYVLDMMLEDETLSDKVSEFTWSYNAESNEITIYADDEHICLIAADGSFAFEQYGVLFKFVPVK